MLNKIINNAVGEFLGEIELAPALNKISTSRNLTIAQKLLTNKNIAAIEQFLTLVINHGRPNDKKIKAIKLRQILAETEEK